MIGMTPNPGEDQREWPLGPNVVGFDAKGRVYCDSSESNSASRKDRGELFLSERTGKLFLVHPGDAEHARRWQAAENPAKAGESASAELESRLQAAEARTRATEALLAQALEARDEAIRQNSYLKDRGVWGRLFFRADGRPVKVMRRILFHSNGKPRGVFRKRVLCAAAKPGTALHCWLNSQDYLRLPRAKRPPSQN
jgi:hypothetical protein